MSDLPDIAPILFDLLRVGTWDWDIGGATVRHNTTWCDVLGLGSDHLTHDFGRFEQLIHPDDRAAVMQRVHEALSSAKPYLSTHRMRRGDGGVVWVEDRGQIVARGPGGEPLRMIGTMRDVTSAMETEQALRASEARFADVAANIPGAIFRYILNPDGHDEIEYMSSGCVDLWEISAEEINADPTRLWMIVHPEDVGAMRQSVLASARDLTQWSHKWRITTPSGKEKWLHGQGLPSRQPNGAIVWNSLILDITDQVTTEAELRRSRELLHQAQKLDALGRLTGGVAHDFNNLLAIVLGNLELLREGVQSAEQPRLIDEAIRATLRGRALTHKMLGFARQAPLELVPLSLNEVITHMDELFRRTLPENIALATVLMGGLWTVTADRNLFENALLNLVINARDAMPSGGKLTVETANLRITDDYIAERHEDLEPGRYVMVAVSDTGTGISPDVLSRVFEPFFTTKEANRGSGLGLSMVHGFVKQLGGTIRVYSEVGVGTTVKLMLKATMIEAGRAREEAGRPEAVSLPPARILLVEDDAGVREVLRRRLMREGFHVHEAADAEEAIRVFEKDAPFDLLLTDVVMPGRLMGPVLAKRLRERQPGLKVVFLSGYPNEASIHGNGLRPDDIQLMKPVGSADLLRALAKALGRT
ncbi:MAG: PAS domain-containing protein [Acetobacteraceae bacterium]|nr:PAS domain-containing protein [Acetobacteraceae bacterium]